MPLRQTTDFVKSLLRLVGLDWTAPDDSTLCRRQRTLNVGLTYRGGTGPLSLLIESTGNKTEGEGDWNARKHGVPKRRMWRRLHVGIDEETLEVRAVEVRSTTLVTRPCYRSCLTKSHLTTPSEAPRLTGPMIRENAMMRLPRAALMPSYPRERMPSPESP